MQVRIGSVYYSKLVKAVIHTRFSKNVLPLVCYNFDIHLPTLILFDIISYLGKACLQFQPYYRN